MKRKVSNMNTGNHDKLIYQGKILKIIIDVAATEANDSSASKYK